jgi:hypothetical protein
VLHEAGLGLRASDRSDRSDLSVAGIEFEGALAKAGNVPHVGSLWFV